MVLYGPRAFVAKWSRRRYMAYTLHYLIPNLNTAVKHAAVCMNMMGQTVCICRKPLLIAGRAKAASSTVHTHRMQLDLPMPRHARGTIVAHARSDPAGAIGETGGWICCPGPRPGSAIAGRCPPNQRHHPPPRLALMPSSAHHSNRSSPLLALLCQLVMPRHGHYERRWQLSNLS